MKRSQCLVIGLGFTFVIAATGCAVSDDPSSDDEGSVEDGDGEDEEVASVSSPLCQSKRIYSSCTSSNVLVWKAASYCAKLGGKLGSSITSGSGCKYPYKSRISFSCCK